MLSEMTKKQRILAGITGFLLLLGLIIAVSWIYIQTTVADRIYPMTYIDGIDMGYKTKDEALSLLTKRDEYYNVAVVEVLYKEAKIATFSGEELQLKRDSSAKVDQAHLIGRSTHIPSRVAQQMNTLVKLRSFSFDTEIKYNNAVIDQFIKQSEDVYNRDPKNALFTFENGKVTSFKADEPGMRLKSDVFLMNLKKEIQSITDQRKQVIITMEEEEIMPEITLAEANDFGIEELIGEGHSDYSHSIPSRIHNVILAATKFDGVIVPQGETFSFNKLIGDISSNTGYQPAYVIKNGRTVLGDGGGVCQVSTTMFRAAIDTGLPITERHAHAYRVSYYENDSEPGFDATIYSPTVDLKFTNDTPAAILIQMELDKSKKLLAFKFYGKKDDRRVEISPATVWDIAPPPEPLYEDDPTLPIGTVKQVDYPAWGAKAKFEYKVFDGQGDVLQNEVFYSSYRPWRAVFLRGTAGN